MYILEKFKYVFIIAILSAFNVWSAVPQAKREALVALYHATDGDHWTVNSNWLKGDPCDDAWYGIQCFNNNTQIYYIGLHHNNLVGSIPVEIGELTDITYLLMQGNKISGSIPVEISYMANLTSLNLNDNQLSGAIPAELGGLSNLTQLQLYNNLLNTSIPEELNNLKNLVYISTD